MTGAPPAVTPLNPTHGAGRDEPAATVLVSVQGDGSFNRLARKGAGPARRGGTRGRGGRGDGEAGLSATGRRRERRACAGEGRTYAEPGELRGPLATDGRWSPEWRLCVLRRPLAGLGQ